MARASLENIQVLIMRKGGECLTTGPMFPNSVTLKCSKEHTWSLRVDSLLKGSWCRTCQTNDAMIAELSKVVRKRGGKFDETKYKNNSTKVQFRCAKNHEWRAVPSSIKSGSWCPRCYFDSNMGTIEEMRGIAEKRGGKCLEKVYKHGNSTMRFQCSKKHIWGTTASAIRRGHWCVRCYFDKKRSTLQEMRELAREHGGFCISKRYVPLVPLLWKCREGHRFRALYSNIRSVRWCRECGLVERRFSLQEIETVVKRRGGRLISVHYKNKDEKLIFECKKGHRWRANFRNVKGGSWCPVCAGTMRRTIQDMRELAKAKGGTCLSKEYVNNRVKLEWQCAEGHQFRMAPASGRWCPFCAGTMKKTIDDMYKLARARGGRCLSKEYVNSHTKLAWQCRKGHQFFMASNNILHQDSWCPKCNSIKKTLAEMQEIARSRGGRCLSRRYEGIKIDHVWECARDHRFHLAPEKILYRKKWCPDCGS